MTQARFFPLSLQHFAAFAFALFASVLLAGGTHAQTERERPYFGDDNIAVELLADGLPLYGGQASSIGT